MSLLQPLSSIASGRVAGTVDPGGRYCAVGMLTSMLRGVPSNVLTMPLQTTKGLPPAGDADFEASWVSWTEPRIGQATWTAARAEVAGGIAAAAVAATTTASPIRPAARTPLMFGKRRARPSSCGAETFTPDRFNRL